MVYFLTLVTSFLLATGQTFWKKAALSFPENQKTYPLLKAVALVIFSPKFLIGALLYVMATLIYLWLFSKYPFYIVQISMVSFSVILSVLISYFIFKEQLSPLNYFGVLLIIIGIILVTKK